MKSESNYNFYRFWSGKQIDVRKSRFEDLIQEKITSLLALNIENANNITNLTNDILESVNRELLEALDKNNKRKHYLLSAYKKAVLDAVGTFEAYQKSKTSKNQDEFLAALFILESRNVATTVATAVASKTSILLTGLAVGALVASAACLVGSVLFPPLLAALFPLICTTATLFAAAIPADIVTEGAIIANNKEANFGTKLACAMKSSVTTLNLFDKLNLKCASYKTPEKGRTVAI